MRTFLLANLRLQVLIALARFLALLLPLNFFLAFFTQAAYFFFREVFFFAIGLIGGVTPGCGFSTAADGTVIVANSRSVPSWAGMSYFSG